MYGDYKNLYVTKKPDQVDLIENTFQSLGVEKENTFHEYNDHCGDKEFDTTTNILSSNIEKESSYIEKKENKPNDVCSLDKTLEDIEQNSINDDKISDKREEIDFFLENIDKIRCDAEDKIIQFNNKIKNHMLDSIFLIAEKIARHSLKDNYYETLKNILDEHNIKSIKSEVSIRTNADCCSNIKERLLNSDFDNFNLEVDDSLSLGDVVISWQDSCIKSIYTTIVNDVLSVLSETK